MKSVFRFCNTCADPQEKKRLSTERPATRGNPRIILTFATYYPLPPGAITDRTLFPQRPASLRIWGSIATVPRKIGSTLEPGIGRQTIRVHGPVQNGPVDFLHEQDTSETNPTRCRMAKNTYRNFLGENRFPRWMELRSGNAVETLNKAILSAHRGSVRRPLALPVTWPHDVHSLFPRSIA